MKTIVISNYVSSNSVFGRNRGNIIKRDIVDSYNMGIKTIIDFEGIRTVTHSFIDELIGAFVFYDSEKALDRISFKNCNPDIKNIIIFVIRDRVKQSKQNNIA